MPVSLPMEHSMKNMTFPVVTDPSAVAGWACELHCLFRQARS
jgi:hypothetical protein